MKNKILNSFRSDRDQTSTHTTQHDGRPAVLFEVERLPVEYGDVVPAPARREELHRRKLADWLNDIEKSPD